MSLRLRILLLQVVGAAVAGAMGIASLVVLDRTRDHLRHVEAANAQLLAITEVKVRTRAYAQRVAELLLLGREGEAELPALRAGVEVALDRMEALTLAEMAWLSGPAHAARYEGELDRIERLRSGLAEMDRRARGLFAPGGLTWAEDPALRAAVAGGLLHGDVIATLARAVSGEQAEFAEIREEEDTLTARVTIALVAGLLVLVPLALLAGHLLARGQQAGGCARRGGRGGGARRTGPPRRLARGRRAGHARPPLRRDGGRTCEPARPIVGRARGAGGAGGPPHQRTGRREPQAARTRPLPRAIPGRDRPRAAHARHRAARRGRGDAAPRPRRAGSGVPRNLAAHRRRRGRPRPLGGRPAFPGPQRSRPGALPPPPGPARAHPGRSGARGRGAGAAQGHRHRHGAAGGRAGGRGRPAAAEAGAAGGAGQRGEDSPPGQAISVECRWGDDMAELVVRDKGAGIPAEDLPRVFDRFYRGRGAERDADDGSGLGLPIARSIVEKHGGSIEIENAPERGATVRILLPLLRPARRGVAPHKESA